MMALDRLLCSVLAAVLLVIGAWFGVRHYGAEQRQAGYDAAVADGKEAREAAAVAALAIESGLRTRLLEQDTTALRKEQEYATNLEAAQRRVRAGVDSLRCPAGPVPAAGPAGDRPAAAGPAPDGEGPTIVPEVAAEILGDGADVAGLVRRYQRVVERFEACRAVNAK
ncbi:hypothetical protein [Massilia varians]|uniref:hypothetical protein n=1 Tax=Massilia varians TaxID=457921 RepID=UPI002553764C|nr:hypothetical protein [Massilia varians]MDK6077947.1 hypothetical protein [Massilia varians]